MQDPHHFGKPEPDPDPHHSEKQDPDLDPGHIKVKIEELLWLKMELWRAWTPAMEA
jgi:hypothetical protein